MLWTTGSYDSSLVKDESIWIG